MWQSPPSCSGTVALDRLPRGQTVIAVLFRQLAFASDGIVTLAWGELSELHVGLKSAPTWSPDPEQPARPPSAAMQPEHVKAFIAGFHEEINRVNAGRDQQQGSRRRPGRSCARSTASWTD